MEALVSMAQGLRLPLFFAPLTLVSEIYIMVKTVLTSSHYTCIQTSRKPEEVKECASFKNTFWMQVM